MGPLNKTSRVLGIAFLLQFITSIVSATVVRPALIVSDDIAVNMIQIAHNPGLMRAYIFLDMITALGIIFLGAMLFITLRHQDEKIALIALGFYILEAALLAASKLASYSLLIASQEYAAAGQPAFLLASGDLALQSMDFVGSTLHVFVFCIGGILFYYLLYQSRLVPRILPLWGLVTVFPLLIGIVLAIFSIEVPAFIYFPYVPFELVIGIWILIRGVNEIEDRSVQFRG